MVTIIVNGRERSVAEKELSYIEIIQLAFPNEKPSDRTVFTVTYSHKNGDEGVLVDGKSVKIKKGMVFNVTKTDKS